MKRIFDIGLSSILLIILFPVMLLTFLLVYIKHGSPIFFKQKRPGKNGVPFNIIKLRTMRDAVDDNGIPLSDKERLTNLGVFFRRTSLDELPELLNVLKGEMSLVGPRPLLMQYMDYYTHAELKRFTFRPGITGLAQVSGRNNLSWDDRLQLDIDYINNWSFWLDLKILVMTVIKVTTSDDVVVDSYEVEPDLNEVRTLREPGADTQCTN